MQGALFDEGLTRGRGVPRPLALKVHRCPLLLPCVGGGASLGAPGSMAADSDVVGGGSAVRAAEHLERRDVTELDLLLETSPAQSELRRTEVASLSSPLPPQHEEAGSSSVAAPPLLAPQARMPRVLDDGPEADAWLGLMKRRVTIEELVAFLYDSISSMTARAEEFLGH